MKVEVKLILDVSPHLLRMKDRISDERIEGIEKLVRRHIRSCLRANLNLKVSEKIAIRDCDIENEGFI